MRCGDKGFKNSIGEPCAQRIAAAAPACLWHRRTPEDRRLIAMRGSILARMKKALSPEYQVPGLDSPEAVLGFAQELARLALTEDVDLRRIAEARGSASLALAAINTRTQQQLVDALLRIEHGGAAFALLGRLQDGLSDGRRRPLPGRVVAMPVTPDGDAP
jgi:hypothetical protein